jgi:hypothetical protein
VEFSISHTALAFGFKGLFVFSSAIMASLEKRKSRQNLSVSDPAFLAGSSVLKPWF